MGSEGASCFAIWSYIAAQNAGAEFIEVSDDNWRADAEGAAGQQLTISLLLRVVADVGIVGFPNAGTYVWCGELQTYSMAGG
jgi:hypothetical protein